MSAPLFGAPTLRIRIHVGQSATSGCGAAGFLFPRGDEESKGFWEGTALGELRG